jgi:serpin B
MLYAGSRGATAQEIARVLNYSATPEKILEPYGLLRNFVDELSEDEGFTLKIADSIWSTGTGLEPYVSAIKSNLGAEMFPLGKPSQAIAKMDKWVSTQTEGLLTKAPCKVTPLTEFVLINTVYLRGEWASEFDTFNTSNKPFSLADGESAEVPMMGKKAKFNYAKANGLQLLEMPYKGNRVSMIVLLPEQGKSLADLEQSLSDENLAAWTGMLSSQRVAVSFPRFKVKSSLDLSQVFQSMGMSPSVFRAPDLSGMTSLKNLEISGALQEAVIIVDEAGTKAAAATAIGIDSRRLPPPAEVFNANRPFMFLLRDNDLGTIFFMGRVTDPRG